MKNTPLIIIAMLLVSCASKNFESEQDLWAYLKNPENNYVYQKNIHGCNFSLLYKPTDLLVKQELSDDLTEDKKDEKIRGLREKYGKYIYLSLSMSKNGQELLSNTPKNRQEFGAMVNQLAFGMGNKVHLFTPQKDTIALLDYNYPRMYGMSQSTNILFVYPRDEKSLEGEYLNFSIEDLGTYTGEVRFKIKTNKIKNQPTLTL